MKQIFKITVLADVPRLVIDPDLSYFESMQLFRGDSKVELSSKTSFKATVIEHTRDWKQFYYLAPGVLVLPEDAWRHCEVMYYVCSMGSELLLIETSAGNFRAINPLDFAPTGRSEGELCCFETFFAPLFRLGSSAREDLYCVSGLGVNGDEFKCNYDTFGFKGLSFEEVWRQQRGT